MTDLKATTEEPKTTPEAEGELSPEQLEKVSGGSRRNIAGDPCEGGEFHAH